MNEKYIPEIKREKNDQAGAGYLAELVDATIQVMQQQQLL